MEIFGFLTSSWLRIPYLEIWIFGHKEETEEEELRILGVIQFGGNVCHWKEEDKENKREFEDALLNKLLDGWLWKAVYM